MQFEHLRYLQTVVECKSMSKAASRLYCTQPAISAAIKSIETELGFPVIERTPKGVVPTELGACVIEDAQTILDMEERWKHLANKSSIEEPVKVVLTGTAPTFAILDAISKTQSNNPSISIDIQFKHEPDAALSHVGERVGIQYKTPAHLNDALKYAKAHGLKLALLQKDRFEIFANANNPVLLHDELRLEDLKGQRLLLYQDPWRFPYIDLLSDLDVNLSTQMFHESNLMVAVSLMNDAITIRPSKTADHNPYIETGKVKSAFLVDCPMPVNLYVSFPDKRHIYQSEQLFVESLSTSFPLFEVLD